MDEDMLKTWGSDDSSMDMMGMMMQMEKFPELYEPFYNNNNNNTLSLTNAEKRFSCGSGISTIPNVNPNITPLTPNFVNNPQISSSNFVNNPMTPSIQPNEVPSGRLSNGSFSYSSSSEKKSSMVAMREMIFRIAVMQPIHIDPESVKAPKRRNVKISKDPQSVAARHRRERISERIRILQRLVPGGTKMDTAAMLDEAVHYVKFLKKQVQTLEQAGVSTRPGFNVVGFPGVLSNANVTNYSASNLLRGCQPCQIVGPPSKQMLS